ncbi:MAG: substrate-binding domain-containing protein [Lachnospiraceae bacterium]|nr:substrate-binding domain-containing protein [Lachnospiraceae bacterium]
MKAKTVFKKILTVILYYLVFPFAGAAAGAVFLYGMDWNWISAFVTAAVVVLLYVLFRKKLDMLFAAKVNGVITFALIIYETVLMVIAKGETAGRLMGNAANYPVLFPFLPQFFRVILKECPLYLTALMTYLAAFLICLFLAKKAVSWKRLLTPGLIAVLCIALCTGLFLRRPSKRYAGHGFQYMNGWSSTDFKDYMVFSEPSKLAALDHPADFQIEDPDRMPVLDGAEACYPLYSAVAKTLYKGIAEIEKDAQPDWDNGKIVTFTNTVRAFQRLIERPSIYGVSTYGTVDIILGARPSKDQMKEAESSGVELEITQIGREGFVFFVEKDNPVEALTSDQIRAIYHGDITNWKEAGGRNQKIVAFQRPAGSGSQTMMEYFMGNVSLKEPMTYETVNAMGGVIEHVAQYSSEAGAIGYTFRYFLEELNQEKDVKMLSVDGVYPTVQTIENGTYPLTVPLVAVTRKNDKNENVRKVLEFLLSEDGQEIIRKTGYAGN